MSRRALTAQTRLSAFFVLAERFIGESEGFPGLLRFASLALNLGGATPLPPDPPPGTTRLSAFFVLAERFIGESEGFPGLLRFASLALNLGGATPLPPDPPPLTTRLSAFFVLAERFIGESEGFPGLLRFASLALNPPPETRRDRRNTSQTAIVFTPGATISFGSVSL